MPLDEHVIFVIFVERHEFIWFFFSFCCHEPQYVRKGYFDQLPWFDSSLSQFINALGGSSEPFYIDFSFKFARGNVIFKCDFCFSRMMNEWTLIPVPSPLFTSDILIFMQILLPMHIDYDMLCWWADAYTNKVISEYLFYEWTITTLHFNFKLLPLYHLNRSSQLNSRILIQPRAH